MPNPTQHFKMDYPIPTLAVPFSLVPNRPIRARLLLADARGETLSTRSLLLSNSGYHVATASTRKEILEWRFSGMQVVVLSDSLGSLGLRRLAQDVRRQWPLARILIIGAAQVVLDDPLYDEEVKREVSPADLLAALARLVATSSKNAVDVSPLNRGSVSREEVFEHNRKSVPAESDPTKNPDYDTEEKEEAQDLPADEHRHWRAMQS